MGAIFVYSLKTGKLHQITDGMSDADTPVFDKGGKYLYFTASTDIGPAVGSGMSVFNRPVTLAVYLVVLNKNDPSPLAPESDDEKDKDKKDADKPKDDKKEEKGKDEKKDEKAKDEKGKDGKEKKEGAERRGRGEDRFCQHRSTDPRAADSLPTLWRPARRQGGNALRHRNGRDARGWRRPRRRRPGRNDCPQVQSFQAQGRADSRRRRASSSRTTAKRCFTARDPAGSSRPRPGPLSRATAHFKMDNLEVFVDPKAEWRQIYREVQRIERDFLYDPHFHGYDLNGEWKKHQADLDGLGSRYDLTYLIDELLSGLSLQHVYMFGGDVPEREPRKGGLLGADFKVENGRHRIVKIYRGESWNPSLRAPLTQPGANVKEGEYLLEVNGQDLKGDAEVYALFEGTAGKQTILKVGPTPDGKGSREVTVVPIESERMLRNLAWVDGNRRAVDKATHGKVAYVYVPDTGARLHPLQPLLLRPGGTRRGDRRRAV